MFKGYFIGQENFKEIRDEIRNEVNHSSIRINLFERSLCDRKLEFGIFVERFYDEQRLAWRSKYSMEEMLKGQLISKCLFGIFNPPKKRTKKINFTTLELFSFIFREN